jgi:D-arabinose 1-dehydrogenase-like Zn-dependent alcohol dehydrogenase
VTVLDLSLAKQDDGLRLGAEDYRCTTDPAVFKDLASSFDLIVSTVPVNVDMDAYVGLLAFFAGSLFGARKPFFVPSPAIGFAERAEGVKGPKR